MALVFGVFSGANPLAACGVEQSGKPTIRFIRIKEWIACADAGYCAPLLSEIPKSKEAEPITGMAFSDAHGFLEWYRLECNSRAALLSEAEFWAFQEKEMLPENPNEVSTFLEGCRVSEDFERPKPDRLRAYGLPDDWPYKMNSSGQVCMNDICTECQLAISSEYRKEVIWVFSEGTYDNNGILIKD